MGCVSRLHYLALVVQQSRTILRGVRNEESQLEGAKIKRYCLVSIVVGCYCMWKKKLDRLCLEEETTIVIISLIADY